jgi:hypothetical protein
VGGLIETPCSLSHEATRVGETVFTEPVMAIAA